MEVRALGLGDEPPPITHAHVDRGSGSASSGSGSAGGVYLMMRDVSAAVAAAGAFHGRTFTSGVLRSAGAGSSGGGRIVSVEFVPLPEYVSRFPEVRDRV